jgi:metallophosphoesterase superfamily enzyme
MVNNGKLQVEVYCYEDETNSTAQVMDSNEKSQKELRDRMKRVMDVQKIDKLIANGDRFEKLFKKFTKTMARINKEGKYLS